MMQDQRTVGYRGILYKDIEKYENPFGKPKYVVVKPGSESTILDPEQMKDFQEIKNEQNKARGINPQDRHFFKPKKPANLTKKMKRQQEQKEKKKDLFPRTEIVSVDVVPSTINESEIYVPQCQDCSFLKIDKISLQKQVKKYKDENVKMQRKYQDLLQKYYASSQKLKEYQAEKSNLQDRLQSFLSLQVKSSKIREFDQIVKEKQELKQKAVYLQKENELLKKDNQAKSTQIKEFISISGINISTQSQVFLISTSSIISE